MSGQVLLSGGRLAYAALTAGALLYAIADPARADTVGFYTYLIAFASAVAAVGVLGLDRTLARRVAAGEVAVAIPAKIVWILAAVAGVVALGGIFGTILGISPEVAAACVGFVVTRMAYAVGEAFWIGAGLGDRLLALALVVNGVLTGAGLAVGASSSAAAMVALSAGGNVAAFVLLAASGRLRVRAEPLEPLRIEAQGVAVSSALAVVYQRVDLAVLAALNVRLDAVAIYGLVLRAFDAATLVRSSIAQHETRVLAALTPAARESAVVDLARRTSRWSALAGGVGVAAVVGVALSGAFTTITENATLLLAAVVVLPLFFSHLPTSALVFADSRTGRLAAGSVVTLGLSLLTKTTLIVVGGVTGAALAVGVVEWLSCLTFSLWYLGSRRQVFEVASAPMLGVAAIGTLGVTALMTGAV